MRCALPNVLVLIGAIALIGGCGRGGKSVTITEAEGTVKLDGKALSGALVEFYPVTEGMEGLPRSTATTDDTGFFKLVCASGEPGAVVGNHRVVVRYPVPPRDAPPKVREPVIPLSYTVASDTPLRIEIKSGQKTYEVVLKGK
jgi:hypothetical protein